MAKRTIISLVDDIDGTVLVSGSGETISFALDGRSYEIDLTSENAASFRQSIRPFVEAGRKTAATLPQRRGRRIKSAS